MKTIDILGVKTIISPEAAHLPEAVELAERYIRERYARPMRISFSEHPPGQHHIDFMSPANIRSAAEHHLPHIEIPLPAGNGSMYGFYGFPMDEITDDDIETAMLWWTSSIYVDLWDGELYIDD